MPVRDGVLKLHYLQMSCKKASFKIKTTHFWSCLSWVSMKIHYLNGGKWGGGAKRFGDDPLFSIFEEIYYPKRRIKLWVYPHTYRGVKCEISGKIHSGCGLLLIFYSSSDCVIALAGKTKSEPWFYFYLLTLRLRLSDNRKFIIR